MRGSNLGGTCGYIKAFGFSIQPAHGQGGVGCMCAFPTELKVMTILSFNILDLMENN